MLFRSNAEPAKKLSAMAEEMEDENEVIEEDNTPSLAERVKALKEARKAKKDDKDHDDKDDCMEEEVELSEDLEAFIQEGIEAGLSEEEILAAIDENFEFVSEETEEETVAEALETYEVDMAEHVNALLEGEIGRAHV